MLQIQILVTRCMHPNSVHRLQSLSSTRFVFRLPALRINHGINNDRSTGLLSSYNKQNNTTKTEKTHTMDHCSDPSTMPWSKFQLFVSISSPCLPQCHDLKSNSLFKLPSPCLPQCHDLNSNFYLNFPLAFHNTMIWNLILLPSTRLPPGSRWEALQEGTLRGDLEKLNLKVRWGRLRSPLKVPSKPSKLP